MVVITIQSDIPVGAGMGSSAAYSCCLSAALLQTRGLIDGTDGGDGSKLPENTEIIKYADFMEGLIHGKPSGCDVQIVMNGGCIQFTRKPENTPPFDIEKLNNLEQKLNFILVNTNKQRECK